MTETLENKTLNGKEPDKGIIEHLPRLDERELFSAVEKLFQYDGSGFSFLSNFYNGYWGKGYGFDAIYDCLSRLPSNHPIVTYTGEIANRILSEVPQLSASELLERVHNKSVREPLQTPITISFDVGGDFGIDSMFDNLRDASYHVVRQSLRHPTILPYHQGGQGFAVVKCAIGGMIGKYSETKKEETAKFADFLLENHIGSSYLLRHFLQHKENERAISLFIEEARVNSSGNVFSFKVFARYIRSLIDKDYPKEKLIQHIESIPEEDVRRRVKEYFPTIIR